MQLTRRAVQIDRLLGNKIGWGGFSHYRAQTPEQGASTHVYAAFDPDVTGEYMAGFPACDCIHICMLWPPL
jgi:hypothetical protein